MRISQAEFETQLRLKAINIVKSRLPVQCSCCKDYFIKEKLFKVNRWGINRTVHTRYYCFECMPAKEDVLNEIDTDECIFGIAFVDDFWGFKKKSHDRINNNLEKLLPQVTSISIQKG